MKRGHLIVFLYGVSTLLFAQFFVRYLLNTGFDSHYIGLIVALAFSIDLLISVPTGVIADALGVKKVSIIGLFVLGAASILGSFTNSWVLLTIGYLFYKVADATVSGVINVWAKNLPESLSSGTSGLIFTRLDQMQRIGMIVMALATGLLVHSSGFTSPMPWVLSLGVTALLIIIASKTECTSKVTAKNRSIAEVVTKLTFSLKDNKKLQTALLGVFVLGICEGLMNSKFWVWVVEDLKLGSSLAIALIVALLSVSRVAGQEFFVRTIKDERKRFLGALLGITLITFVFVAHLSPILLAALWCGRVFLYASYFPLLNKELETFADPKTVSTVLSAAPMLNAVGAVIGGLACSGLKMESQSTFIAMALLSGISFTLWIRAFSAKEKIEEQVFVFENPGLTKDIPSAKKLLEEEV